MEEIASCMMKGITAKINNLVLNRGILYTIEDYRIYVSVSFVFRN